jgi:hypothetical protein
LSPTEQRLGTIAHYGTLVDTQGEGPDMAVRLKAGYISRGGAALILGLLVAPVALLRRRERWATYVLATMSVELALMMLFPVFSHFMDLASLSQARRLLFFLPIPFAIVGAMTVLARYWWMVLVALAAGIYLEIEYHGDFNYALLHPGPGWVAWVALIGCAIGVLLSIFWKRDVKPGNKRWVSLALIAFFIPIAVNGILKSPGRLLDHSPLPAALLQDARELPAGSIVLAPPGMAFRLTGYAPLFAVAITESHGGNTETAKLDERLHDVTRFYSEVATVAEAQRLLKKYDVDYLGVAPRFPLPPGFATTLGPPLYDDGRWKLYEI